MVGDRRYDDRLPEDLTHGRAEKRQPALRTRASLEGHSPTELRGEDVLTWAVLDDLTRTTLEELLLDDHLMPLGADELVAGSPPGARVGDGAAPLPTVADYEHFLAQDPGLSRLVDAAIAWTREGSPRGITRLRPVVARLLLQLEAQGGGSSRGQHLLGPSLLDAGMLPAADRQRLTAAYRDAITGTLVPTYRKKKKKERAPASSARATTAIEAPPDGPARYAFLCGADHHLKFSRRRYPPARPGRGGADPGRSRRPAHRRAVRQHPGTSSSSRSPPTPPGR